MALTAEEMTELKVVVAERKKEGAITVIIQEADAKIAIKRTEIQDIENKRTADIEAL